MSTLVLGPDGEQTCEECALGFCDTRGHECRTDGCECTCRRPALVEVARQMQAERYDLAALMAERYERSLRWSG